MRQMRPAMITAAALLVAATAATPAAAKCTRLAFSVNDYGKEGPTKDAKALLDKYIAQWTSERGIKNYRVGKKDVSCELFLDVIIFDEHTCKAEATVCWDERKVSPPGQAKAPAKSSDGAAAVRDPATPARAARPAATTPITTGTLPAATKPAAPTVAEPPATAPVIAPVSVPAPSAPVVETPVLTPSPVAPPAASPAVEQPAAPVVQPKPNGAD